MTLAPGTALQHGHYVIDAPALEDSLGPLYLATHIPQGRRVLVRVLGSRQPQNIPPADQRSDFFRYLQSVKALQIPLLPPQIEGFEEEGVCYQVLSTPVGSPLSQQIHPDHPLPLAQVLTLLNALTDSLQALGSLGWLGLCLQPDQIWWAPDRSEATWIGFDFPSYPLPSREQTEGLLVQQLGHLLYFLLTGGHAAHTQAPLDVDLCHRRPGLPASLVRALQLATAPQPGTLSEWGQALPMSQPVSIAPLVPGSNSTNGHRPALDPLPVTGGAGPALKPSPPFHLASQPAPTLAKSYPSKSSGGWSRWATYGLMVTALGAGLSGLVVGLQLRNQTLDPSQASRFNPNQSFPPLADWNGNRPDQKVLRPFNRPLRQPDYGDAPEPAPSPSVTRSYPAVIPASPVPQQSATPALPPADSTLLENPSPLSTEGSLAPALQPNAEPTLPAMPTPMPSAQTAPPPSPSPVGSGTMPEPITAPPPAIAPAPSPSPSPVNL